MRGNSCDFTSDITQATNAHPPNITEYATGLYATSHHTQLYYTDIIL